MLKIKKMFKSCICYIVVLALLFSSVPIYSASASETANTSFDKLKEDFESAYKYDKTYIEENKIKKVICCHTSNNINVGQREIFKKGSEKME